MTTYKVIWEMEVDADSPEEASIEALDNMDEASMLVSVQDEAEKKLESAKQGLIDIILLDEGPERILRYASHLKHCHQKACGRT